MDKNIEDVAKKMGLTKEKVIPLVLPQVGTTFDLQGIRYKVTYVKASPYRFTAVPVRPAPTEEETDNGTT